MAYVARSCHGCVLDSCGVVSSKYYCHVKFFSPLHHAVGTSPHGLSAGLQLASLSAQADGVPPLMQNCF